MTCKKSVIELKELMNNRILYRDSRELFRTNVFSGLCAWTLLRATWFARACYLSTGKWRLLRASLVFGFWTLLRASKVCGFWTLLRANKVFSLVATFLRESGFARTKFRSEFLDASSSRDFLRASVSWNWEGTEGCRGEKLSFLNS